MGKISVIGGGAAGLALSVMLLRRGEEVTLLERGDRLGRKLSASGNGQGNLTNLGMGKEHYFSDDPAKVGRALSRFSEKEAVAFYRSMGGIYLADGRGRVYPAGRQASAVTDLYRRELAKLSCDVKLSARVTDISYDGAFRIATESGTVSADKVVLAAGGRAAEHFGTDGTAYALAQKFGHSVTPLSPVLGKLRTDPALVRGLKGIRTDAGVRVMRASREIFSCRGDLLFADGGLSGDAVFRASSYAQKGDVLVADLLPDVDREELMRLLERDGGLLCVVPNGLGRAILRSAEGDRGRIVSLLKGFPFPVTGNFGWADAQATRGGIPLKETDENLQSVFRKGLFFAGEILNVDGECGGYNLQWAVTSAFLAAEGVLACR